MSDLEHLFTALLTREVDKNIYLIISDCLEDNQQIVQANLLRLHHRCYLLPEGVEKQTLAKTVRKLMYVDNIRYPYPIYTNCLGMQFTRIPGLNILMGIHTVTIGQWKNIFSYDNNYRSKTQPIRKISWKECQEFCNKLTEKEGKKYRLPKEQEWEYACKGGLGESPFAYGNSLHGFANFSSVTTSPVGSYSSNPWGLYDMHGNVCEWCENSYDPYHIGSYLNCRVLRGGCYHDTAYECRSTHRVWGIETLQTRSCGLRLVIDI